MSRILGSLLVMGMVVATATQARVWTSVSGNTIEADLVEQRVNDVILRKSNGKEVTIRLSKLSSQDNAYLQQVRLGKGGDESSAGPVPEHIADLFGDELVNADKDDVSAASLGGKVVGVYFSAHWCPPCRQFTPRLVDAYKDLKKDGKDVEIVFVSSDRSKGAMYDYMEDEDMPWLALPFGSDFKTKLSSKYGVRGIPRLVILDDKGKVVADDGRGAVTAEGADAFDDWL